MKKFVESFNNLTQKKIFLLLIFIAYLILSLIFTMTHEIWTDEAQAWLIARDLSVIDIFKYMQYEGHSCLWHLINLPFAKLGFPIMAMNIFSWIITSIACYFILFHSKWNFLVKFFVIFNPTFFYWLSAITRPYCLVPILLCLFVWIYPKRHEHPYLYTNILGLTAHTHIVMCGFVGITAFFFLLEYIKSWKTINKKHFFICFIILFVYFILLAVQVLPFVNQCGGSISDSSFIHAKVLEVLSGFSNYFIPNIIANKFTYLIIVIFIIAIILLFKFNKKYAIIFVIYTLLFFIIHIFWAFTNPNRLALIYVCFVILNLYNKNIMIQLFILILSISVSLCNYSYANYDLYHDFTTSKKTATYINENIDDGSLIIFINSERHASVIPYIHKDLDYYNIVFDKFQTYLTWIERPSVDSDILISRISEFEKQYENIYLILATCFGANIESELQTVDELQEKDIISLEYMSEQNINLMEWYYIYKVN